MTTSSTPEPPPAPDPRPTNVIAYPNQGGRPSLRSPELAAAICETIRTDGLPDTSAAALEGVSSSAISRWKQDDEGFLLALAKARAQYEQARVRTIGATCKRDGTPDWRAQAWLLQKASPEKFGPPPRRRASKRAEPAEAPRDPDHPVVTPHDLELLQAARAKSIAKMPMAPGNRSHHAPHDEQCAPEPTESSACPPTGESPSLRSRVSLISRNVMATILPAKNTPNVPETSPAPTPDAPRARKLTPREIVEQNRARLEAERRAEDEAGMWRRETLAIINAPDLPVYKHTAWDDLPPGMWPGC